MSDVPKITIQLMGGLGNQLFQLAALDYVSKRHNLEPYFDLNLRSPSPHSSIDYMETIFSKWKPYIGEKTPVHTVVEDPPTIVERLSTVDANIRSAMLFPRPIVLLGYFQDAQYIHEDFVETLAFSDDCLTRYPDIGDRVFLHVRGGDYVNHPFHHVDLDSYYERAITMFPGKQFAVFTNDVGYTLSRPWLAQISYVLIRENEVDELFLMSKCAAGICANSSFSWWGGYLNRNRVITLPGQWAKTNNEYLEGLYFPGSVRLNV